MLSGLMFRSFFYRITYMPVYFAAAAVDSFAVEKLA